MNIQHLDKTRGHYLLLGTAVGIGSGIVVSLFRLAIEKLSGLVGRAYHAFHSQPTWLVLWLFVSLVAALFVGFLAKSDSDIKGSGIPQVEGQLRDELSTNWFSVLWKKFVGGVISVGLGLFLGREGPSIQLGAAVAQGLGEKIKANSSDTKILLSSGASAGLAAAFNAPIAGLLFVVEEVHHNFSPLVWLTSFTSAIVANFVSLSIFGLKPVLHMGQIQSLPLHYYGLLLILGVLLGVLGRFYQVILLKMADWYRLLPIPEQFYGLVPFLLVIPIGYFWPTTLGGGNQLVVAFGEAIPPLATLLFLFVLRFVFSMISYGASLPGGIFLPILSLGAIIGAIFGMICVAFFGMDLIYVKNFVIIAMAGYFAAIGKAPLTAIILVTEMVGSLQHLMPLGVVALIAYLVVDLLGGAPIYDSLLARLLQQKPVKLQSKKVVLEFPVFADSPLDGAMVRDINWPEHCLLTSLTRGEQELLIHGDTIVRMGDTLHILTDNRHAGEVFRHIQQIAK